MSDAQKIEDAAASLNDAPVSSSADGLNVRKNDRPRSDIDGIDDECLLGSFLNVRVTEASLKAEAIVAEQERKRRSKAAHRIMQTQLRGSVHALKSNRALNPPPLFHPHIWVGETVVIYGGADVDLATLSFSIALPAAEGPSIDFDYKRTRSGRDRTLGVDCRKRCLVEILALHTTYHRFLAALRPHLSSVMTAGIARRLRWHCPDAFGRFTFDDDLKKTAELRPLEAKQAPDLVVVDLSDVDERLNSDYEWVQSRVSGCNAENPLDRPTTIFVVSEAVLGRTWRSGIWNGCDRVLRAEPAPEEDPEQVIQFVSQQFSSLLDNLPTQADIIGDGQSGEPKSKEQSSLLMQVVELHRQHLSQDEIRRRLRCNRTTVWRNLRTARARGLVGYGEEP